MLAAAAGAVLGTGSEKKSFHSVAKSVWGVVVVKKLFSRGRVVDDECEMG